MGAYFRERGATANVSDLPVGTFFRRGNRVFIKTSQGPLCVAIGGWIPGEEKGVGMFYSTTTEADQVYQDVEIYCDLPGEG